MSRPHLTTSRYPRTVGGATGWSLALLATLTMPGFAPVIVFASAVVAAGFAAAAIATRESHMT